MGYKRKALGDKKIYFLSLLGVFAICAVVGGALINSMDKPKDDRNKKILVETEGNVNSVGINNSKSIEPESKTENVQKDNQQKENQQKEGQTIKESKEDSKKKEQELNDDRQRKSDNVEKSTENTTINNSSQYTEAGVNGKNVAGLNFSKESVFVWPVSGDIIIDFNMESVVYHPTLDVYKCSDSICIQSEVNAPVYAGAAGTILEIGKNSEIGNFVRMNLGNGYEVIYGSIKDIQVSKGLTVKTGDLIGYISEPTKYYSVEGANLYMKMTENGTPVDPLDHLNYE